MNNMTLRENMDCRLLCASAIVYSVDLKGEFNKPDGGDNGILYNHMKVIGTPIPFTNDAYALDRKIDAALLIEIDTGYILAFRGTLPFSTKGEPLALVEDWTEDIGEINLVGGDGLPGKIHEGFYNAFSAIWNHKILPHLISLKLTTSKPLYITGHSKGGPMASYAAYRCLKEGLPLGGVTSFASPYPGDSVFAKAFDEYLVEYNMVQMRYEYHLDAVPFVPPTTSTLKIWIKEIDQILELVRHLNSGLSQVLEDLAIAFKSLEKLDYHHVGSLKYINKKFRIETDSAALEIRRVQQFKRALSIMHFISGIKAIGDAHSIFYGGGYQRGACPNLPVDLLAHKVE